MAIMIRAGSRAFRITTTSSGFARLKYGSTNSSRRPGGAEASSTDDAQIQASPDAARLYDEAINARALDSPRMEASMPRPMIANLIALAVTLILAGSPAAAADGDQVDTVTQQVERGSTRALAEARAAPVFRSRTNLQFGSSFASSERALQDPHHFVAEVDEAVPDRLPGGGRAVAYRPASA